MMNEESALDIYCMETGKKLAMITLNGYEIGAGGPLGEHGTMRSFKIMHGELWPQWDRQQILQLNDQEGRTSKVRVAAIPVDEHSTGLLEFL